MARKNRGIVFIIIGCILLLSAGGWFIYNIAEDNRAGTKAKELLIQFENKQNNIVETNAPLINVDGNSFCGKIFIEKLSVELPVYDEWNYTRLKSAPCRYAGSVDTNDIIIAAHNYKSHFGSLNRLTKGDEIQFIDVYGKVYLYEVCELIILDGTAVSDMQTSNCDFTLFTCTKSGEQRVTVRCERKNNG